MELKNLILQKRVRHGGNPILRWNADNVRVYADRNGGESLSKKASRRRIDGLAALVTAMVRASVAGETASVYETRGLLTI
jgi:phage terminase large subunit-like protein